jgi:hypothetical protein
MYRVGDRGQYELLKRVLNPLRRLRDRELRHDKPGVNRSRFGPVGHTWEKRLRPQQDANTQFARDVAKLLTAELQTRSTLTLRVACAEKLLGRIRQMIEPELQKRIIWVQKDLVKVPQIKWPKLLADELPQTG